MTNPVLQEVRPCVLIRLSDFGIISRNYTDFRENEKTNISVYFRYRYRKSDSFCFAKLTENLTENTEVFGLLLHT